MEDFFQVLNGWYFDSLCLCAWIEFKNDNIEKFQQVLDVLESCIKKDILREYPYRRLQILFVNFLNTIYYLNSRFHSENSFNKDAILILEIFNDILSECPHLSDSKSLDIEITREIIYSFCRTGHFDEAKKIYNTFKFQNILKTLNSNNETMRLEKEIEIVLNSEDIDHPTLIENSYENFILKLTQFLENTFKTIPQPVLYELYKTFLHNKKVTSLHELLDRNMLEKIDSELNNGLSGSVANSKTDARTNQEMVDATPNASPPVTETLLEELNSPRDLHSDKSMNITSSESSLSNENFIFDPDVTDDMKLKSSENRQELNGPHRKRILYEKQDADECMELKYKTLAVSLSKLGSSTDPVDSAVKTTERSSHIFQDTSRWLRFPTQCGVVSSTPKLSHKEQRHKKRIPWSEEESYKLFRGVKKYGIGKWSFILHDEKFPNRNSINLSDRWRNMTKNSNLMKKMEKLWRRSISNGKEDSRRSPNF